MGTLTHTPGFGPAGFMVRAGTLVKVPAFRYCPKLYIHDWLKLKGDIPKLLQHHHDNTGNLKNI